MTKPELKLALESAERALDFCFRRNDKEGRVRCLKRIEELTKELEK